MKQLGTVFRFEFLNYVKRRSYIIITVLMVVGMAITLSWPRFTSLFAGGASEEGGTQEAGRVALVDEAGSKAGDAAYYNEALGGEVGLVFAEADLTLEAAQKAVQAGEYDAVVVLQGPLQYTRYVHNVGMYDDFARGFDAAMQARYRQTALEDLGVPAQEADALLNATVEGTVETVGDGKDQMQNFLYTYILIFLLYMAIVLYGQFVASSVATEKSTRAMELLITSTKPSSLMFGKVFGAGSAGLFQLFILLFTAFLFYNVNIDYYADNPLIQSVFAMPLYMLLYTLLFFVLGYFIYAFLYAALASLVSRMEDLSTAILPVTFLFIIAFMVVMFSMASGNVDTPLMAFCSYFPLTSSMAMFVRIAMGEVAGWKIALSVGILFFSTVGIGFLSAGIYRIGVLLYGNAPKPGEIVRLLRANRASKKA